MNSRSIPLPAKIGGDLAGSNRPDPLQSRATAVAAVSSVALAAAGAVLLGSPDRNPLAEPDAVLLRGLLSGPAVTAVLITLAVLGAMTAALHLVWGSSAALAVVAGIEVVGLGLGLQSVSTIALAGYLLAMALPVALVGLVIQLVRRAPRLRWAVVTGGLLVLVAGWLAGSLRPEHLAGLAVDLGRGFAAQGGHLLLITLLALTAAAWVLVLARGVRGTACVRRLGDWVLRHRCALTLVAAVGPLPYALLRASWLTPWPLLVPGGEVLDPEIRLWGLLLGGSAVLGAVLTVGLIRPWGLVFPRWMPYRAGRPVPVRAAVGPGGAVAGVVTAAAAPMVWATLRPAPGSVFAGLSVSERLGALVVFPFWLWGPSLALAIWGYVRFRQAAEVGR